jgi:hypothetical protein
MNDHFELSPDQLAEILKPDPWLDRILAEFEAAQRARDGADVRAPQGSARKKASR